MPVTDPEGDATMNTHRAMKRFRPFLPMSARVKRPYLIPLVGVLLLFFLLRMVIIPFFRAPEIPEPSAPFTAFNIPRPHFKPPPIRAAVIATHRTTPTDLLRTLETLTIPTTVHHYDSSAAVRNITAPNVDHIVHTSRRPYEDVLSALNPPALFLHAGTRLSRAAIPWLEAARDLYGNRPDIAGFSLAGTQPRVKEVGPDRKPLSWRPVEASTPFAYALLENGQGFFPNVGPHFAVWETFSEWLMLRRSDWYRYPSGEGVDGTPLGLDELPERDWTRAAWNVWFSQYLSEYKLRIVYPGVKGLVTQGEEAQYQGNDINIMGDTSDRANTPDRTNTSDRADMDVFDAGGRPVKGGMFKPETLRKIVDFGMRQGGMVSFTMVNKLFLDTAHSWLCNVDGGDMRPKGLLWTVTDREAEEEMRKVEGSEVVMLDEVKGGKETGHDFGNPGYWRLMLERTALIGEILRQGVAVFAFETDAIWLEDPQPYIDELVSQDADIVGTINTRQEVSGNFFYLRPTLATRRLWDEITERFWSVYYGTNWKRKSPTSWTYIENDQSQLTNLVLRNDTWRRSYPLSFLTLDMELFVDGRWYKPEEGFYTSKRAREPVVINNNFAIGLTEKTGRAKKAGHWFWDEKEKQCLADAVNKAVRKRSKR